MTKQEVKQSKIAFLFVMIGIGFLIFLGALFYWSLIDRKIPSLTYKKVVQATRGNIVSLDNFKVATSKKLYKAAVNTRYIDPDKLDIFINLFSIYSGINKKTIKQKLLSKKGSLVLSYRIDSRTAMHLKMLAGKLMNLEVFIPKKNTKTGLFYTHGLSITESGEKRVYPIKGTLIPVVGYTKKIDKNGITKVKGVKGIERYYEDKLISVQNSILQGKKDLGNYILLDRNSKSSLRIDGLDAHITISLKLQKMIEEVLDRHKKELDAKEIVVIVMHSSSGAILSLATSNRYNPDNIRKVDYPNLNLTAIEYAYEPGSVMKPIIFSLLLEAKKVNPYDLVRMYGGKYKLGRRTISDTHYDKEWISAENVIVHSSNVGIAQLAQKLDPTEYYQGLHKFGFTKKTDIDLPYEHKGRIPRLYKFKSMTYKASVSYGYGMLATFMQVVKAYNVFNNNGRIVTPYIVSYFQDSTGLKYPTIREPIKEVVPISVAKRMKDILIKTVQEGTGKKARVDGLIIGGKTGTAQISENRAYVRKYNSSFVGFANDDKNRFTIGVLVVQPKKKYHYFASSSAVPVFRDVVLRLKEESFLTPE